MPSPKKPERTGGISRLGSLLAAVIRQRQWERQVGLHGLFERWSKLVGGEIAKHAAPRVIRGTVLWVAVSDSVWMQQLHLAKQELLQRINQGLHGPEKISDLRFQLDAALDATEGGKTSEAPAVPRAPRPLDQRQQQAFEAMTAGVADPDLRARLLDLWEKAHRFPPLEEGGHAS